MGAGRRGSAVATPRPVPHDACRRRRPGGPVAPGTGGRLGFDPRNRQAWAFLGGGNIAKRFPEEFEATLAAAPEAELAIGERLKAKPAPQGGEQFEAFEAEAEYHSRSCRAVDCVGGKMKPKVAPAAAAPRSSERRDSGEKVSPGATSVLRYGINMDG